MLRISTLEKINKLNIYTDDAYLNAWDSGMLISKGKVVFENDLYIFHPHFRNINSHQRACTNFGPRRFASIPFNSIFISIFIKYFAKFKYASTFPRLDDNHVFIIQFRKLNATQ